jgi:hypothetical protein
VDSLLEKRVSAGLLPLGRFSVSRRDGGTNQAQPVFLSSQIRAWDFCGPAVDAGTGNRAVSPRGLTVPLRRPVRGQGDEVKEPGPGEVRRMRSAQDLLIKVWGEEGQVNDPRRLVTAHVSLRRVRKRLVGSNPTLFAKKK